MIIDIKKKGDEYTIYYLNGDPKGKKRYWSDLVLHEKLEIVNWFEEQIKTVENSLTIDLNKL